MAKFYGANDNRGFIASQALQENVRSGYMRDDLMKPARRLVKKLQIAQQSDRNMVDMTEEESHALQDAIFGYIAYDYDVSSLDTSQSREGLPRSMSYYPENQPSYQTYPVLVEELE